MNLKFMGRVSERERTIRPFVIIVKNKLMSVFNPGGEGGTRYILGWGGAAWPLIP